VCVSIYIYIYIYMDIYMNMSSVNNDIMEIHN
jgi:hypothetical protein